MFYYIYIFFSNDTSFIEIYTLSLHDALPISLRSSRSSYFATFRHQLTILSKTDALDEEKWLNMLGTLSHFSSSNASVFDKIGRAVQQECRDRSRMPSSA